MKIIDKIMEFITGKSKEERQELARIKKQVKQEKEKGYWKGRLKNAQKEGFNKAKREIKNKNKKLLDDNKDEMEYSIVDGWRKKSKGSYYG